MSSHTKTKTFYFEGKAEEFPVHTDPVKDNCGFNCIDLFWGWGLSGPDPDDRGTGKRQRSRQRKIRTPRLHAHIMRQKNSWTPGFGPAGRPKPAIYPREKANQVGNRKWVRLSIVAGYLLSVSLAAVILTIYYGFIWSPGPAQNRTRTRTGEYTWTQMGAETGSGAAGAPHQKNCLTDRNLSIRQTESHVTSRSNQITSQVSSGVTPVPPVQSTVSSEASQAGQGATSADPSSAEPPVVTAEDPSNLPTHRSARGLDQEPDPG